MMRSKLILLILMMSYQSFAQKRIADISLEMRYPDSSWRVVGINNTYAYIDLIIRHQETDSIANRMVIPPLDSMVIVELGSGEREELASEFNERYFIDYFLGGDPATVKHDDDYLYLLPFEKGKKYVVNQGANGAFSHNSPVSRYAIDFSLKVGELVFASRDGIVVKVVQHFKKAGGRELLWKANRVVILHEDGTTASYVHLDYNGALVQNGDSVQRGQLIGYSGNTGFTRGPHLHFVVRKEDDLSVPVFFEGYPGVVLKEGKKYRRKR